MKERIQKILNQLGLDVKRYPNHEIRRRKLLLQQQDIRSIIDIGANKGQFSQYALHELHFKGNIHSFEPIQAMYTLLEKSAKSHKNWQTHHKAIGNFNGNSTINISQNYVSSSILEINDISVEANKDTRYVSTETIEVATLDSIFDSLHLQKNILLKIDVQGFEKQVFEGAEKSLPAIQGILMEMSLFEVYKNETLYDAFIPYLQSKGFRLHSVDPGFWDENTGQLLQMDGLFFRE